MSKKKKNSKKKKSKSVKVDTPFPLLVDAPLYQIQHQFIGIHNQSLINSMRDSKVRESIRVRMNEETLSEAQMSDLEKRRKELL